MRIQHLMSFLALGLAVTACNRENERARHNEPAARQVGREAYRASQEVKRGAKEAAKDLRSAGREFGRGWSEEKHRRTGPQSKHTQPAGDKDKK